MSILTDVFAEEPPKCGECGGTGEIVNDGPYSKCDYCNGTGVEPRPSAFTD